MKKLLALCTLCTLVTVSVNAKKADNNFFDPLHGLGMDWTKFILPYNSKSFSGPPCTGDVTFCFIMWL